MIEEFNKGFDKRFWQKERFTDLNDIRKKSLIFFEKENKISVLNEYFDVGKEYTGEYVWATIETMKQTLMVYYKDENLYKREKINY